MANPILNEKFGDEAKGTCPIERTLDSINPNVDTPVYDGELVIDSEPMTISGTMNKLALLFGFVLIGAFLTWSQFNAGMTDKVNMLMIGGGILGFILAMVIIFQKTTAKFLAPIYAICEGLLLGGISAIFEKAYPGVVFQAVSGSFAAFAIVLFLYKSRAIRYTQKFAAVMLTALLSICVIYLIQFFAGFFGRSIPLIFESGPIGIGFSAVVVVIAALSFIQDFNFIELATEKMLPKYYEWYGAFGVLLTFIWLYMEILRLLAKLRQR